MIEHTFFLPISTAATDEKYFSYYFGIFLTLVNRLSVLDGLEASTAVLSFWEFFKFLNGFRLLFTTGLGNSLGFS